MLPSGLMNPELPPPDDDEAAADGEADDVDGSNLLP